MTKLSVFKVVVAETKMVIQSVTFYIRIEN